MISRDIADKCAKAFAAQLADLTLCATAAAAAQGVKVVSLTLWVALNRKQGVLTHARAKLGLPLMAGQRHDRPEPITAETRPRLEAALTGYREKKYATLYLAAKFNLVGTADLYRFSIDPANAPEPKAKGERRKARGGKASA